MPEQMKENEGRQNAKAHQVGQRVELLACFGICFQHTGHEAIQKIESCCQPDKAGSRCQPAFKHPYDTRQTASEVGQGKNVGYVFFDTWQGWLLEGAERVMNFFKADGRFRAMAGVHHHVIRHDEEFLVDASDKCVKIASRQVRTANALVE